MPDIILITQDGLVPADQRRRYLELTRQETADTLNGLTRRPADRRIHAETIRQLRRVLTQVEKELDGQ